MLAIAPGREFEVQRGPDWLLVRIKNLDPAEPDSPPLAEKLWDLLERHFTYRLVLELDEVPLLNSNLIGQLIRLYRRIREHDGLLRLSGLSPYNRQVLHTCRLDERLPSYRNCHDAVMGVPRQPR